jgi:hypothetical protein
VLSPPFRSQRSRHHRCEQHDPGLTADGYRKQSGREREHRTQRPVPGRADARYRPERHIAGQEERHAPGERYRGPAMPWN